VENNKGDVNLQDRVINFAKEKFSESALWVFSRLVGSNPELAKKEQQTQKIRDQTKAMTMLTDSVALSAVARISSDPAFADRMIRHWLEHTSRSQENRENIVAITIEELQKDPLPQENDAVSDDWMNIFGKYAENINSEELQHLWGRVLAGEIRKSGTISLRTLHFMSLLDKQTAELIKRVAPISINSNIIFEKLCDQRVELDDILQLKEIGFLNSESRPLTWMKTLDPDDPVTCFIMNDIGISFVVTEKREIQIPCYKITTVGSELLKIIPIEYEIDKIAQSLWELNPATLLKMARVPSTNLFDRVGEFQKADQL
jgi:hypothetical protein